MKTRNDAISPLTPIIAGLVVFAIILIYGTSFASYVGAQLPESATATSQAVELDAEWRWQPETVRFDGMYRTKTSRSIEDMYSD
jgi:hypothetical protein